MAAEVMASSRQMVSIPNDDNNNNSMLSEQQTGRYALPSDDQHRVDRNFDSPVGKLQDWNFHQLRRTTFITIDQARKYRREGQTALAIEAYKNTLEYCGDLERRNKNSGENRIEFNRQISIMKLECREQLDEMPNEGSSAPITTDGDQSDDIEFCNTLHEQQSFTDNNQFEMPHSLVLRQLVRMIVNKTSCNNYLESVHNLPQEQTEQEPLEVYPQPTRQCGVCMIEQSLDQFKERYSNQCQHIERIVCNTCVYNNTKSALEDMQSTEVICPEPDCQAVFGYNEVYEVLLKSDNRRLFEFYDRQLTYRRLEQMSEFNWCPYPGCDSGQLNERSTSARNRVICIKCKRMICLFHQTKWHTGMTCEEYDQSDLPANNRTKQWLNKYSKQCPDCKSPIQKYEGCDHMTCTKCRHQFCWECLADHKLIRSGGLHQHKPTCSHHPEQRAQLRRNISRLNACTIL